MLLQPGVINLFQSAFLTVCGAPAQEIEARLVGATDEAGLAYESTPYRWRRLRLVHPTWHGLLPAPALPGIYQLQLRIDHARARLSSAHWLLRVFAPGIDTRRSFRTPVAVIRDYVARLPGDQVVVALKRWPMATFDHRDRRLNRLFVIAYAPQGDSQSSSRLGMFITTGRDGFHGPWQLLEVTGGPYD